MPDDYEASLKEDFSNVLRRGVSRVIDSEVAPRLKTETPASAGELTITTPRTDESEKLLSKKAGKADNQFLKFYNKNKTLLNVAGGLVVILVAYKVLK